MSTQTWKVLVPVEILEGETLPDSVVDILDTVPVVLLGYHVLPEQTPPGQARIQFEDQAQQKLDALAEAFDRMGDVPETRLVFTQDEEQTLDRIAEETGCSAYLIPNPAQQIERLLVPLRGEADVVRISAFVAALIGDRDIAITLFHVAEPDKETAGESMVQQARNYLEESGIAVDSITTEVRSAESPVEAITEAAVDHDATVMGESEPSLRSFLFGEIAERVARRSLGPVFVVRRETEPTEEE